MGGWNFIDRTGMTFGKLKVQKYLGNKNYKKGPIYFGLSKTCTISR